MAASMGARQSTIDREFQKSCTKLGDVKYSSRAILLAAHVSRECIDMVWSQLSASILKNRLGSLFVAVASNSASSHLKSALADMFSKEFVRDIRNLDVLLGSQHANILRNSAESILSRLISMWDSFEKQYAGLRISQVPCRHIRHACVLVRCIVKVIAVFFASKQPASVKPSKRLPHSHFDNILSRLLQCLSLNCQTTLVSSVLSLEDDDSASLWFAKQLLVRILCGDHVSRSLRFWLPVRRLLDVVLNGRHTNLLSVLIHSFRRATLFAHAQISFHLLESRTWDDPSWIICFRTWIWVSGVSFSRYLVRSLKGGAAEALLTRLLEIPVQALVSLIRRLKQDTVVSSDCCPILFLVPQSVICAIEQRHLRRVYDVVLHSQKESPSFSCDVEICLFCAECHSGISPYSSILLFVLYRVMQNRSLSDRLPRRLVEECLYQIGILMHPRSGPVVVVPTVDLTSSMSSLVRLQEGFDSVSSMVDPLKPILSGPVHNVESVLPSSQGRAGSTSVTSFTSAPDVQSSVANSVGLGPRSVVPVVQPDLLEPEPKRQRLAPVVVEESSLQSAVNIVHTSGLVGPALPHHKDERSIVVPVERNSSAAVRSLPKSLVRADDEDLDELASLGSLDSDFSVGSLEDAD